MDSLTPGTQATLDRLTAQARAVIEPVPWTWIPRRTAPVDAALCAQRRADRAQMDADRRRCGAYPALPMRYI